MRLNYFACAALLLTLSTTSAQDYTLTRVAGAGPQLGDGAPATKARFATISAIASGPDGSVYVADPLFHTVRRMLPNGTITAFAGTGFRGHSGDGGPATAAQLNLPTALVVDRSGQVYIGEGAGHYIRRVGTDGKISTIAGNGQAASASTPLSIQPLPALSVPLNYPIGIAILPSGDLAVADANTNAVLRISLSQNTMWRIAGGNKGPVDLSDQPATAAALQFVTGIAADLQGNLYIVEYDAPMVRKIDSGGMLTRVFGSGSIQTSSAPTAPELAFRLIMPRGIVMDSSGAFYVGEARRISRWDPSTHTGTVVAGDNLHFTPGVGDGGPALAAGMAVAGVAVDSINALVFADSNYNFDFNNRVRRVSNNTVSTLAGGYLPALRGDKGPATAAELYQPERCAVGVNGELYITDRGQSRIRRLNPNGSLDTFAGNGQSGGGGAEGVLAVNAPVTPTAVAVDPGTGRVYFAAQAIPTVMSYIDKNGIVHPVAGTGSSNADNIPAINSHLNFPSSLAVDTKGNVFLGVLAGVRRITTDGLIATVAGGNFVGNAGDGGPAIKAEIDDNPGVNVDAQGNLYIAGDDSASIRKVIVGGIITTVAGGGASTADGIKATAAKLAGPLGVAVDAKGNLIIADTLAGQVKMVDASTGIIRTIAGGSIGFGVGEGGPATAASLYRPYDVQVDKQGDIYVVDTFNQAVYKLTPVVAAPPPPVISSIRNEASLAGGAAAVGERVLITGTSVGPATSSTLTANADGSAPTSAVGFQVLFDEVAAPLLAVSAASSMVQVPYEVAGRDTVQVMVVNNGVKSAPYAMAMADSAPAIYVSSAASGQADALNGDGTPNGMNNPAASGSTLTFTVTGEGQTSPRGQSGVVVTDPGPIPTQTVSVQIGGLDAVVIGAVEMPGTIGKLQVQVTLPDGLDPTQPLALVISVGTAQSQDGVVVWGGDAATVGAEGRSEPKRGSGCAVGAMGVRRCRNRQPVI